MNKTLEQALRYAKAGFKVYPLAHNTKVPIKGTNGFNSASSDPEQIKAWFSDSDLNIGISLVDKKVLVVDLDVNHKQGVSGIESYQQLHKKRHYSPFPTDSYIERTATGDLHWFLSYPATLPVKNLQSAFFKDSGIDIVTAGVVVAPSMIDGKSYKPLDGRSLIDIKTSPEWLLQLFKPNNQPYRTTNRRINQMGILLNELVSGTTQGTRNTYLTSICGKVLASGCDSSVAYEVLLFANEHLSPPLPESEVNTIFKSILNRESRRVLS